MNYTTEERLKVSLHKSSLDIPSVRLESFKDSKKTFIDGWTKGYQESKTIEELIKANLNVSIRTGKLENSIHLIALDIDKGAFVILKDRLLKKFKEYFTVKTPSGVSHIFKSRE